MEDSRKGKFMSFVFIIFLFFVILEPVFPQQPELPDTILPDEIIKLILNEVSGQFPFNNEVVMSGYNRIRTPEEFETYFHEAEYLAKKLREYGVDEVKLEDLADKTSERKWWIRVDAELWMVEPEMKRLSRLAENPALMVMGCNEGEWEGELVYIDRRDISNLKDRDFTGKIILSPESIFLCEPALKKGALGIISYRSIRPFFDPFQVTFDMGMPLGEKGKKVFAFKIWPHLGEQLRDMIFRRQKVVLRAVAKTESYPFKLDTILATIKGKSPEKKGFMFTAHLFERPLKQGANDNISGCVTLAEIARTITTLIREGKIERPERSIYFLVTEEGRGTLEFFKKYPEMADKILGAINMDMVGENLDENHAFFNIEMPPYSNTSFIQSVPLNFTKYVFETNIERHSYRGQTSSIYFPVPIVEKNGSMQPFRFLVEPYVGGSDHMVFLGSDSGISALSFNVWPDFWYHTDKDRPDKSDPTQLKRVAFIGTASALAICSGDEEILENLVRITYEDRLIFVQDAVNRWIGELSRLKESDRSLTYMNAVDSTRAAVDLSMEALSGIKVLTQKKGKIDSYLDSIIKNIEDLLPQHEKHLRSYYSAVSKLKGFKPEFPKVSEEEVKLKNMIPVKVKPLKLGDWAPYSEISGALRKKPELLREFYKRYDYQYLMQLFFSMNGKKDLAQIRRILGLEFKPVPVDDFMEHVRALEEAKLIRIIKE